MKVNSLSGRFAFLTFLFVLLAEVLILFPALGNHRLAFLESRLERAQIASLALLTTDDMISSDLEAELLENAEVYNIVLRRDDLRQLVLSSPLPGPVTQTYDLREADFWTSVRDATKQLLDPTDHVIRVIGEPVRDAGQLIEVTFSTPPLRESMIEYGFQLLILSAAFSIFTALLLNLAAQRLIVLPMRRVIQSMSAYAANPQDPRTIISPGARMAELREAETALKQMQTTITSSLKQRERLANLGQAVAKISHDLRNILTTSQIFADRLEESADPAVKRAAPKLVNSITRAVNLCETTLTYGKAEEPAPSLSRFLLRPLAAEVIEAETLADEASEVEFLLDIPPSLTIAADRDQIYRVLSNLLRNGRQAIEATGKPGQIEIGAGETDDGWFIRIGDTGPGLPEKTRSTLFKPFSAVGRKGGTGLGLAIAWELVHGHGGSLKLIKSDGTGTEFMLFLPAELQV